MSNLSKLEFTTLDISGNNYLPWTLDAKIHLTANNLGETINVDNQTSPQNKAKAMIFLRHHLHEDLKREYLTVEDPLKLWTNIKERFDHQKLVLLPKARYEWLHLRLQDFKTVSEYNSALFRITSELKLCGEKITDEDMLEKTFSTFHASNMLLSQQYRERQFTKYSELISCLLVAEQNNKLLLQNHQSRPAGASPFPEANVANYQSGRGRGRGRDPSRGRGRGRGRGYTWHRESQNTKNSGGESSRHNTGRHSKGKNSGTRNNICYKCGMSNHWSRTCHTPKHLVEAYQRMMKEKGKNAETNLIENAPSATMSDVHMDACDFIENVRDV
ncbi:putative transcription factor interactor and regulator CCHC(Zn) family [Helianthus annuus]|nr:putative transcription factor interactor and regulator CCHC(Zn) family [Helianthus annuus]